MPTGDREKNTDTRRQRSTVTRRLRTTDTRRHKATRHRRVTAKEETEAMGITPAKVDNKTMGIQVDTAAAAKGVLAPGRAQHLTLNNANLHATSHSR